MSTTYTRNGKKIGELEDNVLRKKVKTSVHLYRMHDAWGIDKTLLDKVLVPAKATIEITDTQAKRVYRISAEHAKLVGVPGHYQSGYEDYGAQLFVSRHYFEIENL